MTGRKHQWVISEHCYVTVLTRGHKKSTVCYVCLVTGFSLSLARALERDRKQQLYFQSRSRLNLTLVGEGGSLSPTHLFPCLTRPLKSEALILRNPFTYPISKFFSGLQGSYNRFGLPNDLRLRRRQPLVIHRDVGLPPPKYLVLARITAKKYNLICLRVITKVQMWQCGSQRSCAR